MPIKSDPRKEKWATVANAVKAILNERPEDRPQVLAEWNGKRWVEVKPNAQ